FISEIIHTEDSFLLKLYYKFNFATEPNYITQDEWIKLWQKALQVNYKPVANIKAIKPNKKGDKDIQAAIKETSKYSVKSSDYLTGDHEKDAEIVSDLEQGLHRKRMLSYGGLLKQKHKILNLDDAEDGDLVKTSDDERFCCKVKNHVI
ncbi:protein rep, partial [Staphylococcus pettenkoferi]|uniref:protein rep n=1 Tax=Staphylococcus pettenkoferi TaxID=170573 RepID=UPI0021AB1ED6